MNKAEVDLSQIVCKKHIRYSKNTETTKEGLISVHSNKSLLRGADG